VPPARLGEDEESLSINQIKEITMQLSISNPFLSDSRGNQVYSSDGSKARNSNIVRVMANDIDGQNPEDIIAKLSELGRDQLVSLAQKSGSRATVPEKVQFDKSWSAEGKDGEFLTLQFRAPRGLSVDDLDALLADL
jgi:hypothetical protein